MAAPGDVYECSCPGPPPPLFDLPPPPPPPALRDDAFCSEMHTCDLLPVADAELQWGRAVPSAAVIAVAAALLVAAAVVVSVLLWKYKRKRPAPILMPFKPAPSQAGSLQPGASINAVPGVLPPQTAVLRADGAGARTPAPILLDGEKKPSSFQNGHPFMERPTVFVCPDPYSQPADIYNPIYQEVDHGSPDSNHDSRRAMAGSDEAEDDGREAEEPHYYTLRRYSRPHALSSSAARERRRAPPQQPQHRSAGPGGRRHQQLPPHRSLDRRRHRRAQPQPPHAAEDGDDPADCQLPVAALSYRPQQQQQQVPLQFSTFRSQQQLPQTGPGPPYAHTSRRAPHRRRRSTVANSDLRLA